MKKYHFDIGDLVYIDLDGYIDVGICVEKMDKSNYRFIWQRDPTKKFYNQEDIWLWFNEEKCHAKRYPIKIK